VSGKRGREESKHDEGLCKRRAHTFGQLKFRERVTGGRGGGSEVFFKKELNAFSFPIRRLLLARQMR